jgi:hypothetical protein
MAKKITKANKDLLGVMGGFLMGNSRMSADL